MQLLLEILLHRFSFLQNRYVSFNFYEKWLNFQKFISEAIQFLSSTLSVNSCCKPFYVIRQWFSNRLYIRVTQRTLPKSRSRSSRNMISDNTSQYGVKDI